MLFLEYSLMIWTICNKLISFYRNAVSLHIIFVVTHGEIFSQLGHTGPLTVNKMALPSRYRRIWRHIHALIGRNTIALGVQRFAAGANIICLTYATDWWAVIGPVIHGESKSQATRDGAARTTCRCGSTSLASCQHVGRFCVRVCSLFVCNWRARFKQNIIVLCICRHDMVAIMMSNPGLSNKFDVDPLSNSDSKMSTIVSFRAGGWSLSPDLRVSICVESVSSAVLKYQHIPCDCEWKSHISEGTGGIHPSESRM